MGTTTNSNDISHFNSLASDGVGGELEVGTVQGGVPGACARRRPWTRADNTSTTGTGVPIYWFKGDKVADDYADFYDGSWDSNSGAEPQRGLPFESVGVRLDRDSVERNEVAPSLWA